MFQTFVSTLFDFYLILQELQFCSYPILFVYCGNCPDVAFSRINLISSNCTGSNIGFLSNYSVRDTFTQKYTGQRNRRSLCQVCFPNIPHTKRSSPVIKLNTLSSFQNYSYQIPYTNTRIKIHQNKIRYLTVSP